MNPLSNNRKKHILVRKLPVSIPTTRLAQLETDAAFAGCCSGADASFLSHAGDQLCHNPLVDLKSGKKSATRIKHAAPSLSSII